jgi:2-desacetyl-2-hydroxyethyl bacteriochlorophyllide A dehydrogenase
MKTIYAVAEYGKVVLKNKELPTPGPDQLLLEAEYSALSPGTEYSLMSDKMRPLPQCIGYSMIARVLEAGTSVTNFKAGDLVAATSPHASYWVLNALGATPVPEGIDLEQAAFFILAHTALYGIRRTKLQLGEAVVVLGQGMVGLLAAKLALLSGACPVLVTDISDERLAISRAMGVHVAVNTLTEPDGLRTELARSAPDGPAVVLEAAGAAQTIETSFNIAREQTRVMHLSAIFKDTLSQIDFSLVYRAIFHKGIAFLGSGVNSKPFSLKRYDMSVKNNTWPPTVDEPAERFVSSDIWTSDADIRTIMKLIKYNALNIGPLITHRFNIDQIPLAYELVWQKDPKLLGGLISWK